MFFSVIVPIYKVEKYVRDSVDSVLAQTFSDFELILVDDGSPDGCPAICDAYAEQDGRIKVIHKANGGLVSARQAGIREAKGEYVFNLDGDDAITPDTLEAAYDIIQKTGADIVSFSYRTRKDGIAGDVVEDLVPEKLYAKEELIREIWPKLLSDENMEHIFYYIWGKAIRREFLTKHQLNVNPVISLGEDLCCGIPCFLEAESVYMSKKATYFYTVRTDSLSTDFKSGQITQIADVIQYLKELPVTFPHGFDEQIARYSCFMCLAIVAAAAEGDHVSALPKLEELILNSVHAEEMPKAKFARITPKSRIAISLMQRGKIAAAFRFLRFCKDLKHLIKKG